MHECASLNASRWETIELISDALSPISPLGHRVADVVATPWVAFFCDRASGGSGGQFVNAANILVNIAM